MKLVSDNGSRNDFVTGSICNKIYGRLERLRLEGILPFFAALMFWTSLLPLSALSAAEGKTVSSAAPAGEKADKLIKSQKASDRHEALEQIRRRKDKISTADMNAAFSKEKDPALKTGMLRVIAAAPGAAGVLVSSLKTDPSSTVRQSAAQELGRYTRDAAVVTALCNALKKDRAPEVRYACALSLAFSNTPAADTALEGASKDRDPNLRRQAAFSLKKHTSPKAAAILKKLEMDPDVSVKGMAKK